MTGDLGDFILSSRLCDTHEHMEYERIYEGLAPDVLRNLFDSYVVHDLASAGATPTQIKVLLEGPRDAVRARFDAIRPQWEAIRHTGYGEAVGLVAQKLYGIDELTGEALAAAEERNTITGKPGERLRLLRDVANLDHIQTDPDGGPIPPEIAGQDFFLYDLNVFQFCAATFDAAAIGAQTGRAIHTLADLEAALEAIFERSAECAVAIKSQHAYSRTLLWRQRSRADAEAALTKHLRSRLGRDDPDRLCLGDWCIAKLAELSVTHRLPFKIHTGYYAHNGTMPVDYIKSGNLSELLIKHPRTKFVLMHIAYPYSDELVALAKHFPGVTIDMCWAWSINPFHAADFLRRFLHAVPSNKLFPFGGDSWLPVPAVGYALQARKWLARALEGEVADGLLSEKEALAAAKRLMMDNAYEHFAVEEKKAALRSAPQSHPAFELPRFSVRSGGKAPAAA